VPRCVRAAQDHWRDRIEADPIQIIGRRMQSLLAEVKIELAKFLGGSPHSYGFVTNATEGVNAVLRSIAFEPGDELLCTDHVYNAVRQAMRNRVAQCGALLREVPVAFPTLGADEMLHAIAQGVNSNTRLVIIDHITSPTAIRFPVERLRAMLPARALLLIDGAHAPGGMRLDVPVLDGDFYAANLHKWVMAPRGSAFVQVTAEQAPHTHPCIISHEFGKGFEAEFDWQGTRDFSAWLAIPAALQFLAHLGYQRVLQHNHQLAVWAHALLVHGLDVQPASPLDGSCLTTMATVRLPDALKRFEKVEHLQADLYSVDRIEVPIIDWGDRWWVRVSAAVHNLPSHYEQLLKALRSRMRS